MNQFTQSGITHTGRKPVSPFARARQKRQLDELIDQYVAWREASGGVEVAYGRWKGAGRVDRDVTFSIYWAALDREEEAAFAYQAALAQLAATLPQ